MKKVYAVFMTTGKWEDYYEELIKVFVDKEVAEKYVAARMEYEMGERDLRERCAACIYPNRDCPFFVEPQDVLDGCENKDIIYTDDINFEVRECELVE